MSEVNITPLGAFLLGQQLRRNLAAVREPVAYLYNGVRLPKLPEWDKAAYPYAIISKPSYTTSYLLKCYTEDSDFHTSDNGIRCFEGSAFLFAKEYDRADWTKRGFIKKTNSIKPYTIWANFDLLNEDGTVYLPASDPIPIPPSMNKGVK